MKRADLGADLTGDNLKVSIPSRRWPPAVKKRGSKHRVETFRFLVSEFEIETFRFLVSEFEILP